MAAPHLDSASFPQLRGFGQNSFGTVTGTQISQHDAVNIVGRSGNKRWEGEVTSRGSGNTWNATVQRVSGSGPIEKVTASSSGPIEKAKMSGGGASPDATETVDVTVTNSDGTSNKVPTDSDVP
jgi:hypothetical protein